MLSLRRLLIGQRRPPRFHILAISSVAQRTRVLVAFNLQRPLRGWKGYGYCVSCPRLVAAPPLGGLLGIKAIQHCVTLACKQRRKYSLLPDCLLKTISLSGISMDEVFSLPRLDLKACEIRAISVLSGRQLWNTPLCKDRQIAIFVVGFFDISTH